MGTGGKRASRTGNGHRPQREHNDERVRVGDERWSDPVMTLPAPLQPDTIEPPKSAPGTDLMSTTINGHQITTPTLARLGGGRQERPISDCAWLSKRLP